MATEETVDELVDKAIEDALNRANKENEEIFKRKPKPFRYLKDPKEIKEELATDEPSFTVMEESPATKIYNENVAILGLGDIDTIENVIKRHQASRGFNKN